MHEAKISGVENVVSLLIHNVVYRLLKQACLGWLCKNIMHLPDTAQCTYIQHKLALVINYSYRQTFQDKVTL